MEKKQAYIQDKIELSVSFYKQAYGVFPNAAFSSEGLIKVLNTNNLLKDGGAETKEYSGLLLKTKYNSIKLYWFGRIKSDDLENLSLKTSKKFKGYKSGGVYPLLLATQKSFHGLRKIFKGKRFENILSCDMGVPLKQLEQKLSKQIKNK